MSDSRFRAFHFLVDIGVDGIDGPYAGFQECAALGLEVTAAEFRQGTQQGAASRNVELPRKATDVTLTRGLIGSQDLHAWLEQARDGDPAALRTVRIELLSEDHGEIAQTWRLLRARILRYVPGPLNAKGTDVAIEELTLGFDGLELG